MGKDFCLLAVDPGTAKCGLAVLDSRGNILDKEVCTSDELAARAADLMQRFPGTDRIAVGSGTGSKQAVETLRDAAGLPGEVMTVEEKNTTLDARKIYQKENPRPWPLRLVPFGLFSLPRDMDAYAAAAIGLNYLRKTGGRQEE